MVFTVIWITPGLSHADHRRALEAAPEFAEAETDYPALLAQTGWTMTACLDVSAAYASSAGAARAGAVKDLLLRRDLFVATPTLR